MNKKLCFLGLIFVFSLAFSSLASTNWSFDETSIDTVVFHESIKLKNAKQII